MRTRRWVRWGLLLALVLSAASVTLWFCLPRTTTAEKVARIRPGVTAAEARAILGVPPPAFPYSGPSWVEIVPFPDGDVRLDGDGPTDRITEVRFTPRERSLLEQLGLLL